MFADAKVTLPRGVGTSSPDDVARAVVRVIERNIAEVDVAPLPIRLGGKIAGVAPGLAASLQHRFGAERIANEMAKGQADKR
jgi:hypothetical protein